MKLQLSTWFVLALSCLAFYSAANESVPSLAQVDAELAKGQSLPLGERIQLRFSTDKAAKVAKSISSWEHVEVLEEQDDALIISLTKTSQYTGPVDKRYLSDTFVIDISEKSTIAFSEQFSVPDDTLFSLTTMRDYVSEYINVPTYIHGFNFASTVAEQRSGDCTEYAVLLTALARTLGLPSRVVLGTVLLEENEQVSVFGHAWTEVYYEDEWHLLDAALGSSAEVSIFYLPTSVLSNEGPGFMLSMAESITLFPTKVSDIKSIQ
jgi:hypothetical protein